MSSTTVHCCASEASAAAAHRWRIAGRVQGVGFRPFVYRLAHHFELSGWVRNNGGEVEIHAQGAAERLRAFGAALLARAPAAARPQLLDEQSVRCAPIDGFRILASATSTPGHIHVPPDLFTCNDCLEELRDPAARRYRYPFINCTQCGPRYTLIRALPYDRPNTTMDRFVLCRDCAREYADPLDRRFHAQPLACPACGPMLRWRDAEGREVSGNATALAAAQAALRTGRIVAARGVGGYHLLCDAADESAVARLRERKGRPAKPLAVMVPWRGTDGLGCAHALAHLSPPQQAALRDCVRPIVLAARRADAALAPSIAPGLRELGLMLPYSPLHHLLLEDFGAALVATSGNLSGEPVLTEPEEVESRLADVADGFLHHDRPIVRPADDPVVRAVAGSVRPIRLGRGTAPLELTLPVRMRVPTLAVGAYIKNTVALAWGDRAVVSPHIGDLDSPRGRAVFAQVAHDLQQLYGVRAECIAHDAHPQFPNTRWARECGLPSQAVWHHHAHAAAVAGEYACAKPLLCFTWDGVGLGADGTLWGGEALLGRPGAWQRVASFRPFRLLGGERAAREPWRTALALCWESGHPWPEGAELGGPLLRQAFDAGLNAPETTAVGRLFDAAAALLGVCRYMSYEGEAPMRMEALCEEDAAPVSLPLARDALGIWRSDWAPLVPVMADSRRTQAARAAVFHSTLAHTLCDQALAVRAATGVGSVGLAGGVFQNRILSEQVCRRLAAEGFAVFIPQRLPVNDAAISYGQLIEVAAVAATH
ncbi:MAG TPA: carbamoyltransferase HypF [Burkholderiales bacterium]|nr:carbamoyltransferase HypF [Burkholderiales bacterium]